MNHQLRIRPPLYGCSPISRFSPIYFHSILHPLFIYFLVVGRSHIVATGYCTCKHHATFIRISGRTNWEPFRCHCTSSSMVRVSKHGCCVVVSSFLPIKLMPRYQSSPIKFLLLLDDCMNYYDSRQT